MRIFAALALLLLSGAASAAGNGAIWTTRTDCGSAGQDVNQFGPNENVYIHGSNFDPGTYGWSITGQPSSCDSNAVVASGNVVVGSDGMFCFQAYTVSYNDCGVYKNDVGGKNDNYQVTCVDRDGDGYDLYNPNSCPTGTDCDDTNPAIHPGAAELCNNMDDNCNGQVDEGLTQACGSGLCLGTSTCSAGQWSACTTSGVECRPAAGVCDTAEYCGVGASPACPADGFLSSAAECRASAGACDVPEMCTGNGAACPADGYAASGTACGSGADTGCDNPDTCDGSGQCSSNYEPASTVCRPDAGECDVPEYCDGAGSCPINNGYEPAGTSCGSPADGLCDNPDTCDGGGSCQDNFESPSTVCRPDAGECDVEEKCDGAGLCPADAFEPAATACGSPSDGVCDNPDSCDGSGTCLSNVEPSTTECRADAGECDVAENCDGSGSCPVDSFESEGTACGSGADTVCDNPDTCSAGGVCQTNPEPATTECRADAGECDVPENCDGAGQCPADAFEQAGTACGDGTDDVCDNPDACDDAGACLTNYEPATTVCNEAAGVCDVEETCDGAGSCPADGVAGTGTICLPVSGECDTVDYCDGLSKTCDTDSYQAPAACYTGPAGTEGVGICHGGQKVCSVGAPHEWGTCDGEVTPGTEVCNGVDDNCNGLTDELTECMACTLTQGYWKTHSGSGPAPYDVNWQLLPGGLEEDTVFFLSGQTWLTVFKTAPAGNPYYQLAHQYMAAKLNVLTNAPAVPPAGVTLAMSQAESLLSTTTPASLTKAKGSVKTTWVNLAGVLGSYNEGKYPGGPRHCGDQELVIVP